MGLGGRRTAPCATLSMATRANYYRILWGGSYCLSTAALTYILLVFPLTSGLMLVSPVVPLVSEALARAVPYTGRSLRSEVAIRVILVGIAFLVWSFAFRETISYTVQNEIQVLFMTMAVVQALVAASFSSMSWWLKQRSKRKDHRACSGDVGDRPHTEN